MADYARVSTDDAPKGDSNHATSAPMACPKDTNIVSHDDGIVEASVVTRRNRYLSLFPAASPAEYKQITKQLATLSWPVMLYMITSLLLSMTSIIFTGHLGKDEIVASSLAQSVIHVFWRAVLIGFTSGADTLFSQTYGSKNKKRVGIIFQRFLVLCMLLSIVCWGFLLNTEGILLLFGQDPHIAQFASPYGVIFIAATPADTVVILLIKYLECQSIVRPLVVIVAIMGGLNVLLHFITVSALQFGLLGAITAQVITYYLGAIMLLGYICKRNIHEETWPGWSWECLQEWGTVVKLSIAGMGTACLEWGCFEAGFFISGLVGKTAVGAHAVLFNTTNLTWCVASGFGIGGAIMIGNYLGANKPTKAHITSCCCIIITVILGVVFIIFYFAVKDVVGYIFTKDVDVVHLVASIIPIVALGEVFDSGNVGGYGILRGCGYLYVGSLVCFLGYAVGIPLGVVLTFDLGYGLRGLWLGMLAALIVQFILLMSFIFFCIKWDKEVIKAQRRAAVLPNTSAPEYNCIGAIPLETLENCLDEAAVVTTVEEDTFERNSIEGPDQGLAHMEEHRGDKKGNTPSVGEDCNPEALETHDNDCVEHKEAKVRRESSCSKDEKETDGNEEEVVIEVLTLDRLSFTQLVLRRGLALFICVSIFVVSIFISVYIVPAVRPTIQDSVNRTANYTADYFTESP